VPSFTSFDLLQILILATGIYLVLSLLRTTQGSGLVRGLGFGALVLGVGMYALVDALELRELEQVLDAILGVATIVLAILFQPELRRGILSLGEHQFFGRFLSKTGPEALSQVCDAAIEMARKRQGALIAFERKTPLDTYADAGARIDAPVSADLLDSIFHPGAALHDGAVVLREGRVVAAAVLFPLSENADLSKSTGTRHRAALGLTEQTDAVAVIVSEETGALSIAVDGVMERRISRERFPDALAERLGLSRSKDPERAGPGVILAGITRSLFTTHIAQKAIALGLGFALFLVASNQVTISAEFAVRLAPQLNRSTLGPPIIEQVAIIAPPGEDGIVWRVFPVNPVNPDRLYRLRVQGPREVMRQLEEGIGGNIALDQGTQGELTLDASAVRWGAGGYAKDLRVQWVDGGAPRLDVRAFTEHEVEPLPTSVVVKRGHLDERYEVEGFVIRPSTVHLLGPADALDLQQRLAFEPVSLPLTDQENWSTSLALSPELVEQDFSLVEDVYLEAHVVPRIDDLGTLDKEVVLVSFDPARPRAAERFAQPDITARLRVRATRLLSPDSDLDTADVNLALRKIVAERARVYVDVSRMATDGSRTAKIEVDPIPAALWIAELPPALRERLDISPRSQLLVELAMEDETLVLEPLEPSESPTGGDEESQEDH
jgi:diadenylate cyclase